MNERKNFLRPVAKTSMKQPLERNIRLCSTRQVIIHSNDMLSRNSMSYEKNVSIKVEPHLSNLSFSIPLCPITGPSPITYSQYFFTTVPLLICILDYTPLFFPSAIARTLSPALTVSIQK